MPGSHLQLYNRSLALLTDMYQMTMSYGFWKQGLDQKEAVFHLFFRKRPFEGGFTVAAGLELVIDFLENFRFSASDMELEWITHLRAALFRLSIAIEVHL
jgi:nicotinate phosphoribosyltransferase